MILVTGNRGFVGGHLCSYLDSHGIKWTGIDLKDGKDIMTAHLPDAEKVYHLAAQTNAQTDDVWDDADNNIFGTLRIVERYRHRVVFASSSAVNYPLTPYAISKRAGEDYALMYGAAVVRFCNLYGPGGHGVIDIFRESERIEIRGDGNQIRTYAPVEDAVSALIWAKPGLHILPGKDMTVNEVADMFPGKTIDHVPANAADILDGRQRAA